MNHFYVQINKGHSRKAGGYNGQNVLCQLKTILMRTTVRKIPIPIIYIQANLKKFGLIDRKKRQQNVDINVQLTVIPLNSINRSINWPIHHPYINCDVLTTGLSLRLFISIIVIATSVSIVFVTLPYFLFNYTNDSRNKVSPQPLCVSFSVESSPTPKISSPSLYSCPFSTHFPF